MSFNKHDFNVKHDSIASSCGTSDSKYIYLVMISNTMNLSSTVLNIRLGHPTIVVLIKVLKQCDITSQDNTIMFCVVCHVGKSLKL